MKRLKIVIYISTFFLVLTISLAGTEILNPDEYIKTIQTKLPEIKQSENKIKKQANKAEKAYAVYDPTAKLFVYGQGNQAYPDNENMISHYSPGFGGDFSVNTVLPSGTRLSGGFTYSQKYTSGENTTVGMRGDEITTEWSKISYDPVLKFGITQPVLYNWFGFLDRWGIKNEQNKLNIEKISQDLNNENLMREYKKLYFNWISIMEKLTLIEKSIDNARKQLEQTEKKVNIGLLEKDSLESVRYSLLRYQNQKLGYQKDYINLQNQLTPFIDLEKYQPDLEHFNQLYSRILAGETKYIEFHDTLNARILNLNRENYEFLKKAQVNKTMPSINLFANLDVETADPLLLAVDHDFVPPDGLTGMSGVEFIVEGTGKRIGGDVLVGFFMVLFAVVPA